MQLGFLLYGDLSTRTGGFLYDRMIIQGLKDLGAQVEVIPLPWHSYPISLLLAPITHKIGHLLTGRFDLLIEDELAHPSLIRTNRSIRQRSNIPIISLVHHLRSSENHPTVLNLLYRRIEEAYLNTIDGVITNSPHTLHSVQSLLDRDLPSLVAPPGRGHYETPLAAQEIERRAHQKGPLQILFLGSVIPRKRLDALVEALASLDHIDFRLTVIGRASTDQQYTHAIKQLIHSLGMEQNVCWLGEQPDERVTKALEDSHLLVVPSSHEGFGISYLDAMGYGVIPIGARSGGASSLIQPSKNGFLIDPEDVDQLAGHIERLAIDRELLSEMAINALQRFHQQPTWKEVSGTVYDYLQAFLMGTNDINH